MGKPAACGCETIKIDAEKELFIADGKPSGKTIS